MWQLSKWHIAVDIAPIVPYYMSVPTEENPNDLH